MRGVLRPTYLCLSGIKLSPKLSDYNSKLCQTRSFSSTLASRSSNRVYDLIRDEPSFRTLLLTAMSSNQLLLTLWTASYCSTCRTVLPVVKSVVSSYPSASSSLHPAVGFVEVELDAPDVATSLSVEYGIRGVPTLMAFSARRGEPRFGSRVEGAETKKLGDKAWVEAWIRERVEEEARSGGGGGGQGLLSKLFGVGGS